MQSSDLIHATGMLIRRSDCLALRVVGGGHWKLDDHGCVAALLGRQVEVEGSRSRFNALACERIWLAGEAPPRHRYAVRMSLRLSRV
jgi:hypothetical protein